MEKIFYPITQRRLRADAHIRELTASVKLSHKSFIQPLFVDANFFDIFSFQLIYGNQKTVLSDINAVVVTESTAKKFFNTDDVVGKILQLDADPSYDKLGKPLVISGVVKDPPANSSLQFDLLFTFQFVRRVVIEALWSLF